MPSRFAGLGTLLHKRQVRKALRALLKIAEAAPFTRPHSPWELAPDLRAMRKLGLTDPELEILLTAAVFEQRVEITKGKSKRRVFKKARYFDLDARSHFALAEAGLNLARCVASPGDWQVDYETLAHTWERPCWNSKERELWVYGVLADKFQREAPQEELLLSGLEDAGWRPWQDNPFSPGDSANPSKRVRTTVKNLNKRRLRGYLHFRVRDRGKRYGWSFAVGKRRTYLLSTYSRSTPGSA
jgi:hypothetical protein